MQGDVVRWQSIFVRQKMFFLSETFRLNIQNLDLTCPILGELRDKIETVSTHNVRCQKFATLCLFLLFLTNDFADARKLRPIYSNTVHSACK